MSDSNLRAQIAAAKAYEEFFVPALFGEWATRVAAVAQVQTGNHVLDRHGGNSGVEAAIV